jgi:hypothetical protein
VFEMISLSFVSVVSLPVSSISSIFFWMLCLAFLLSQFGSFGILQIIFILLLEYGFLILQIIFMSIVWQYHRLRVYRI